MTTPHRILGRRRNVTPAGGLALCLGVAGAALTGCQAGQPTGSTVATEQRVPAGPVFSADRQAGVLADAVDVLRDAGYRVDRADYRLGVVTTEPKGVATAVEPWSPDRLGGGEGWAATLSPMRRVVRVTAEPVDQTGPQGAAATPNDQPMLTLRWEVQLERYTSPRRRVINASRGRVFSSLDGLPQPWSQRGLTGVYWQPMGRDVLTEQRLAALAKAR